MPPGDNMLIDHIGIMVPSLEKSIRQWETTFGYRQSTEIITNTRQHVKVVFLTKENSLTVKLFQPLKTTSSSVVAPKPKSGLHHLCFRCEDMAVELPRLKDLGLKVLVEPQPGEAFDNENIAFVLAGNGLNVEIIDTEKRSGSIPAPEDHP